MLSRIMWNPVKWAVIPNWDLITLHDDFVIYLLIASKDRRHKYLPKWGRTFKITYITGKLLKNKNEASGPRTNYTEFSSCEVCLSLFIFQYIFGNVESDHNQINLLKLSVLSADFYRLHPKIDFCLNRNAWTVCYWKWFASFKNWCI